MIKLSQPFIVKFLFSKVHCTFHVFVFFSVILIAKKKPFVLALQTSKNLFCRITVRPRLRRVASFPDRVHSHHRHAARAAHHGLHLGPLGPPRGAHHQRLQHRLDRPRALLRQQLRVVPSFGGHRVSCGRRGLLVLLYFRWVL